MRNRSQLLLSEPLCVKRSSVVWGSQVNSNRFLSGERGAPLPCSLNKDLETQHLEQEFPIPQVRT